jgi:peptidoglycan/xylan/chitin deacetylase (PgdA/CDA1 family)
MKKVLLRHICLFLIVCLLSSCGENDESRYQENIVRGDLPTGLISLTYDDGPGPSTLKLAKYLYEQNISATFFVNAKRKYRDPDKKNDLYAGYEIYDLLDSLVKYGHRIGNHSANHLNLKELADNNNCEELKYQLLSNQQRINSVINNYLCYFRPPWGAWSEEAFSCINTDETLSKLCGPILWKYDSKDYIYGPKNVLPEKCGDDFINAYKNNFQRKMGGVVLIHDLDLYDEKDYSYRETKVLVPYLKRMGYIFVPPTLNFSSVITSLCEKASDFSDEDGWATKNGFYSTIRLADADGDGKMDLVALGHQGVYVALSNGMTFGRATLWNRLSKTDDWLPENYNMCLQSGDVNGDGKADVIIRGKKGIYVSFSKGMAFSAFSLKSDFFSDNKGWAFNETYYGSIRLADVDGDGKADIVARSPKGIYVAKSLGKTFDVPVCWNMKDFSDIDGWLNPQYGLTIQCADVNADGMADVVGRKSAGIYVALSTGSSFKPAVLWTKSFNSTVSWVNSISSYGTFRLADVNGDKRADLIVRSPKGLFVALSKGDSFYKESLWTTSNFKDQDGWRSACYATTVQCGDINGDKRADVIGRSRYGIIGVFAP